MINPNLYDNFNKSNGKCANNYDAVYNLINYSTSQLFN